MPIYDIPASALKKPLPYTIPDNLPEGVVLDGQQVPNVIVDAEAPVIPVPDVVFGTAPNSPVQSDAGSDIDSVLSSGSIDDILALDCPWSQPSTPLDAELEPAYTGAAMNAKLAVSLDSSGYGLSPPQYQQDNVFDFSYGQGVASYPTGDYIVASGSTLPNQVAVNHPISLPRTAGAERRNHRLFTEGPRFTPLWTAGKLTTVARGCRRIAPAEHKAACLTRNAASDTQRPRRA